MSDLVERLKIRGMQPREMPNHYTRRMEVERIEAANEIARLTALLASARRDALEEAANEVDCGGCVNVGCVDPTNCWHKAAQDIRALIAQEDRP